MIDAFASITKTTHTEVFLVDQDKREYQVFYPRERPNTEAIYKAGYTQSGYTIENDNVALIVNPFKNILN